MADRISISRSKLGPLDDLSRIDIISDIQNLSDSTLNLRSVEQAQVQWVLDNRVARKIEAVLHTGDHVNDPASTASWANAYVDLSPLFDKGLLTCTGNHCSNEQRDTANLNALGSVVGHGMGDLRAHMTGLKDAGRLENSYKETTLSGRPWLLLSLEFGPRNATVEWAETVLRAHPGVPAILLTHAFMYRDGTIYQRPPIEYWNPIVYNWTPDEGINTGTDLVTKLVNPYSQIKLVVCGHAFSGHSHGTWTRADGTKWHGIQQDYQNYEDFSVDPRGFMYELTLDFKNDAIIGRAFSPLTTPVTEWPETLSSEQARYNNVYIANAGIR